MAGPRVERKLAAILAADVVGYSRLVGADEAGTIARLKALRKEFIEPLIAEYRGRVVKLVGDGALVEFASAVNAVLSSYSDAAGSVHHPIVSAAMRSYRETHQKEHLSFPVAVRGLGSNTAHGGAAVADGNNEATAILKASLGDQEVLGRDINASLH